MGELLSRRRIANSPAASDQESHGGVLVKEIPGFFCS